MSDVATIPVKPKFWCTVHGRTNEVIDLFRKTQCLACLHEVATAHCAPVFRLDDIAPPE